MEELLSTSREAAGAVSGEGVDDKNPAFFMQEIIAGQWPPYFFLMRLRNGGGVLRNGEAVMGAPEAFRAVFDTSVGHVRRVASAVAWEKVFL